MSVASVASASINPAANLSDFSQAGLRHYAEGRFGAAIAQFEAGLAAAQRLPEEAVPSDLLADLHAKLANALLASGCLGPASESYKAALRLVPNLTNCWCNLGNVQFQLGDPQQAIALYLQALKLNPGHWPARTNLVQALVATKQHDFAKALLLELIAERPTDPSLHHQFGKLSYALNELVPALTSFETAVTLDPNDADSLYWIGGIRQKLGDSSSAKDAYVAAARLRPLIRRPAAQMPAAFRILVLFAPFGGNTPAEFLFRDAAYDIDTLAILPSVSIDPATLPDSYQLVVNLISEADQAPDMVRAARDLVRALELPVINDPDRVMLTTRDGCAGLLQGVPGCRVPQTQRIEAWGAHGEAVPTTTQMFSFPLLARPAGTHGGDYFERIVDVAHLEAHLAARAETDHYLIEYLDYRSRDGYFRKYRLIFVGNEIFPYHLAIGNDWKLHRDTTDMGQQVWMQQEEEAFLRDPWSVFDDGCQAALRAIRDRIGLDYFGIDCGIDISGRLVVFEVNASMLVHDEDEAFAYKNQYVGRIKTAFEALLSRVAGV